MARPSTDLPDVPLYRGANRIAEYDDIDAVLRDQEMGAVNDRIRHEFLGGTLVHLDGDEHRRMRRLHGNLFRRDALDFYEREYVIPSVQRTMDSLRGEKGTDGVVHADLVALCRETLSDMGCRLIGLGDLTDDTRRARFLELSALIISGIMLDTSTATETEKEAQHERAIAAREAFWEEFVGPAVAAHREKGELAAEDAYDLLDLLLADDPDMDRELIVHNCSMYISGSQGAVIQSVTHTFDNLCRWFEDHPDRTADELNVDFLRHAAFETLRLTPPQGILVRIAGHDKELPSGHDLTEGELVAMQLGLANHDPEVFGADPLEMDPERCPAREGVAHFGLAFGAGPHVCIGRRLALPARDDGGSQGIMLRLLEAVYAAGIEPDPDNPPDKGQNIRPHFERYPVIFRGL